MADLSSYQRILKEDLLWYVTLASLINESVLSNAKKEVVQMFTESLKNGQVFLGNKNQFPEYFNDNDRLFPPDTVVIHHTDTSIDASYDYVNLLGLLRLYIPVFKDGFPDYNGQLQPIASGHYYNSRQTFIGYHYLVWNDGRIEQILDDKCVGWHAGDYPTNCRSIGIALVDDLTNKQPTEQALKSVLTLIQKYQPKTIIGHKEVIASKTGQPVQTMCPGNLWNNWKSLF